MALHRRAFLEATAAGAAASTGLLAAELEPPPPVGKLPTRTFGKLGWSVPLIGFGSGSRFLMYQQEAAALEALNRAIDLGVYYLDTAHSYGDGESERRIGQLMPQRRKEVLLATKIGARKGDEARRQIELSLKRLQTDHLDVLHIHALSDLADLATIEAPDGVLQVLYKAREQKITRAIGITCHADPLALQTALERHDFDCTQMALNAALARMANAPGGMKATSMPTGSFEELALPVARRKNLGVIAMKVFGQDQITSAAPIDKLLRYTLSLPVSLASLGMPKLEYLTRNVELARGFQPMTDADRRELQSRITQAAKISMRDYFVNHVDA